MAQSHAALVLPTQVSHRPEKWKRHIKAGVTICWCQRLHVFLKSGPKTNHSHVITVRCSNLNHYLSKISTHQMNPTQTKTPSQCGLLILWMLISGEKNIKKVVLPPSVFFHSAWSLWAPLLKNLTGHLYLVCTSSSLESHLMLYCWGWFCFFICNMPIFAYEIVLSMPALCQAWWWLPAHFTWQLVWKMFFGNHFPWSVMHVRTSWWGHQPQSLQGLPDMEV